ncbi:MAG: hypothetical protein IBX40_08505 [Methanosarcinales archaeon]|nr:hypothetical protein [Methanosarcinales archaeon]
MEKQKNMYTPKNEDKTEDAMEISSFKNAQEMPTQYVNFFGCKASWLEDDME